MTTNSADFREELDMEPPRDIANFLRRALFNHKGFNSKHVVVQVVGRKVFLEGSVMLSAEKEEIEKFVRAFPFVEMVSSYITFRR
jgi:osmotically-inducible protein OsmY